MSKIALALMFGFGVGGWVYSKVSRRTGNQLRISFIVSGFVGLIALFVLYTTLSFFIKK